MTDLPEVEQAERCCEHPEERHWTCEHGRFCHACRCGDKVRASDEKETHAS